MPSQIYGFLEGFACGIAFKRDDPSTIHWKNLPIINEKCMCFGYGLPHENFTWDISCEPGVVGASEKVYQTEDLIVSFDVVNIRFPNKVDIPENKPWPHQDQDPENPGFRVLQGLVNLLPNGPDDGRLLFVPVDIYLVNNSMSNSKTSLIGYGPGPRNGTVSLARG